MRAATISDKTLAIYKQLSIDEGGVLYRRRLKHLTRVYKELSLQWSLLASLEPGPGLALLIALN
jgi:hypothetical protein